MTSSRGGRGDLPRVGRPHRAHDQRARRHSDGGLYIVYRRAHKQAADRGITVKRSYVGEYCTSLDMAGASVTLVKLDDELEGLFDAPRRCRSASS